MVTRVEVSKGNIFERSSKIPKLETKKQKKQKKQKNQNITSIDFAEINTPDNDIYYPTIQALLIVPILTPIFARYFSLNISLHKLNPLQIDLLRMKPTFQLITPTFQLIIPNHIFNHHHQDFVQINTNQYKPIQKPLHPILLFTQLPT